MGEGRLLQESPLLLLRSGKVSGSLRLWLSLRFSVPWKAVHTEKIWFHGRHWYPVSGNFHEDVCPAVGPW